MIGDDVLMSEIINALDQIPEQYRHLFKILIDQGVLKKDSSGGLHIGQDMYEIILMLARKGLLP